jgi:hypothetical protein
MVGTRKERSSACLSVCLPCSRGYGIVSGTRLGLELEQQGGAFPRSMQQVRREKRGRQEAVAGSPYVQSSLPSATRRGYS